MGMVMVAYLLFGTIFSGLMGLIWSNKNLLDACLKLAFIGMSVWGCYLLFQI